MNHSHVLYDSDPHFKIDPISRNIIDESSKKVRLIQHDHNSERFTFEIPRYIEGHDTASCNLVEIHYVNLEANTKVARGGVYTVDDLQVKSDDANVVVCSWLIPNNATQYVGQLQFLVRFSCVNESTGKVEYVWNTAIYSGITVASGIYNSDSQSDNPVHPYNFVTTLDGSVLKFYVGSEEEYNKLVDSGSIVPNCLYYITDEATPEEPDVNVNAQVEQLSESVEKMQETLDEATQYIDDVKNGNTVVPRANILSEGAFIKPYDSAHIGVNDAGLYLIIGKLSNHYYTDLMFIADISGHSRSVANNYYGYPNNIVGTDFNYCISPWSNADLVADLYGAVKLTDVGEITIPPPSQESSALQSKSFIVRTSDGVITPNLYAETPTVGRDDNGNVVFTWDTFAIKISSLDLFNVTAFLNGELNLKQGDEITIYPFDMECSGYSEDFVYEFIIDTITTSVVINYNGTGVITPYGGSWGYAPYTLRFELVNGMGKITLTDNEGDSTSVSGVDYSQGVKILVN